MSCPCVFIFLTATVLCTQLFSFLFGSYQANIPLPTDLFQYFLYTIVICILPAVCEEYVYRGIVIGVLGKENEFAAVLLSAFFFAIMHATLQQIPVAFCAGLILGYFYIRHQSLILCIALHFCNNFLSLIFPVLCRYISGTVIMCSLIVLGCISLFFYFCNLLFGISGRVSQRRYISHLFNNSIFKWTS